ncbi:hypothetical protein AU196_10590 [Mycobacterium sp. IS-1742]|uniref:Ig-like domain-containing protein n=1 Tax=Mycobacterium sp. IS-1742 TaxID=1772285 RepID=UPI00073FD25D|nr:Ig-like domain-containing protein [Mycobacterium sp. IS-1742]KUI31599.1 hypothetical protein AU196_10590 [Mycobacterium sp. IS-1742]
MAGRRGVRRSESFAVRRWLQLGAASAGVGAGLLGFSLLGPQVGTAAAETAGESSTSASASASDDKPSDAKDRDTEDTEGAADADADDADDAETEVDEDDEPEVDDEDDTEDEDVEQEDEPEVDEPEDADEPEVDQDDDEDHVTPSAAHENSEAVAPEAKSQPQARSLAPKAPSSGSWSEVTGRAISNWTDDSQGWINSLPVDNQAKYHLEGALWATRRTFFNQAPNVAPIQISGKLDGPVVGTIGAVDPDGDRLFYVVTRGPRSGSVHVNADGTYTYTPGADFDGVDTFRVVAVDVGPHVNLLDPFRRVGTSADNLVNQRAIRFTFAYRDGAEHWTPERRAALNNVADQLVEYFTVTRAVTVTYDVLGEEDATSRTLAWAYSEPLSEDDGYWRTVVQNKIISGVDSNGEASDGQIAFNFANRWGLGETVRPDEFDFTSTAIHEILHSFGFMTGVGSPGDNTDRSWLIFDGFIVAADGRRPIGSDHVWDTQYDPYLIGQDGGLYFGGANAIAAYGGFVPLFTPTPWMSGSSMHHLDDDTFTGVNQKVMNAMAGVGPHARLLSPIELGILRDLGYRVSAPLVQL